MDPVSFMIPFNVISAIVTFLADLAVVILAVPLFKALRIYIRKNSKQHRCAGGLSVLNLFTYNLKKLKTRFIART